MNDLSVSTFGFSLDEVERVLDLHVVKIPRGSCHNQVRFETLHYDVVLEQFAEGTKR